LENEINVNIERKKIRIAYTSMFAAIVIVSVKLIASLLSGSLAVLSELFHSSIDLVACFATIISVKISSRPPDEDHNYGHEKVESFSALFQVIILILMCAYLIYEAIHRLIYPPTINIDIITFSVIIICIFIDYSRSRALKRVAKETNSQALEADSLHFTSDILSSIVVLISMLFTYFNISKEADSISAIVVSVIIILTTLKLSKRAIDSLMDRVPAGLKSKIEHETEKIEGLEGINNLRIRSTSSKIFIDLTVQIARTKLFSQTHEIMNNVERKIKEISPLADIVVHSEPIETDKETINEKIRMIVINSGFKCHDIFSHKIKDEIITELHVEIDDTNDLTQAHRKISSLEDKIKQDMPIISKTIIHLDEPSEILFDTIDITDRSNELIKNVKNILSEYKNIESYSDIEVVNTNGKIRVSLNCKFGFDLSFEEVHDLVTVLESKIYLLLKELYPKLSNVIIHAEPSND
jgi:cation diffusion facilitator family transporter